MISRAFNALRSRPFRLAALFLFANGLALTLAPLVRARSIQATPRLGHWPVFLIWWGSWAWVLRTLERRGFDLRLPWIASLLTGWGMLSIARLSTYFGWRQAAWLLVAHGLLLISLHRPALAPLHRHKSLWLWGGLILTATTLIFGTNPAGGGPRLWLGCCGVYLQPSEPLKLLLLIYLAAYLADRQQELRDTPSPLLRLLFPTLLMTALALIILIAQRDLGTATLVLALYAMSVYLATNRPHILALAAGGLGVSTWIGYRLFDVVRLRVDAWVNPWADPSGRAYQIVQSLIAIANGGLFGRGPGMGNPGLVPVAHSDFIFTTIAEEGGLIGTLVLLSLLFAFAAEGLRIASRQTAAFPHLLAGGLSIYIASQWLIIIGGNLRLLPLTGVTLPFVSYGGSSLVTAHLALGLLLHCARLPQENATHTAPDKPLIVIRRGLIVAFGAAALLNAYWAIVRAPLLLRRTDNPRREIAARTSPRGDILDRNGLPLAVTEGQPGDFRRCYLLPGLGAVIGYTHPRFGQAGLEAALDDVLRGEAGQPWLRAGLYRLLYGTPPPGLGVSLTLDATWQAQVDDLLGERAGAVVIMDTASGEVLVMASHPTFNANRLDDIGEALQHDPRSPLLNRATQALYPAAGLLRALGSPDVAPLKAAFRLPQAAPETEALTPLQAALLLAAGANHGTRPAPQIVTQIGTRPAAPLDEPHPLSTVALQPPWDFASREDGATWFVSLRLADASHPPLALALVLEEGPPRLAEMLGTAIWESVLVDYPMR